MKLTSIYIQQMTFRKIIKCLTLTHIYTVSSFIHHEQERKQKEKQEKRERSQQDRAARQAIKEQELQQRKERRLARISLSTPYSNLTHADGTYTSSKSSDLFIQLPESTRTDEGDGEPTSSSKKMKKSGRKELGSSDKVVYFQITH